MSLSFLPRIMTQDVTALTPEFLHSRGIDTLFMDFDNTIVPYSTNEPTPEMKQWLLDLVASDIFPCVVSNSHKDRVKIFCDGYGIPCITHSYKPFGKGISRALTAHQKSASTTALVGDQIFTDVLGGNLHGLTSILVKPIALTNIFLQLRYVIEQPFIWLSSGRKI